MCNKICDFCKNEFYAKSKRAIFCSNKCKSANFKKNHPLQYEKYCENCGQRFFAKTRKAKFCSFSCSSTVKNKNGINSFSNCKLCGNNFHKTNKTHLFCSIECKSKYNSINCPSKIVKCSFCNKEIKRPRKNKNLHNYCSKKCELSFTKKSLTSIHVKVIDFLKTLNVDFEIEKNIKSYYSDCFVEPNLIIEILGTYWHCDPRKYTVVTGKQKDFVKHDRTRHRNLIENNFYILYLWQIDIEDNFDICKNLITKFIQNDGVLQDYNSLNYSFEDEKIFLNNYRYFCFDDNISPVTTEQGNS